MDSLLAFFEHYSEYGLIISYGLILFMLLISGFGIPIPEDITLVAAGILASTQGLSHGIGFLLISMAGVLIGDSTMYAIGYIFGVKILRLKLMRKILTAKRIQTIRYRFQENAISFLFIARFLPGLRAAIYLFSGITRKVSYLKFISVDFCAAIISVPVWVSLGYLFGNNLDYLKELVHRIGFGVAIAAVVLFVIIIVIIKIRIKNNNPLLKPTAKELITDTEALNETDAFYTEAELRRQEIESKKINKSKSSFSSNDV